MVTLRPTVIDRDVLAFDVASFAYALSKCGPKRVPFGRADVHETDHRRLLRARRNRPCSGRRCAAEHGDELSPSDLIEWHLFASTQDRAQDIELAVFLNVDLS